MAADEFNKDGIKFDDKDPCIDDKPSGLDAATKQLNDDAAEMYDLKVDSGGGGDGWGDSSEDICRKATGVKVESVIAESSLIAGHESKSMMKKAFCS